MLELLFMEMCEKQAFLFQVVMSTYLRVVMLYMSTIESGKNFFSKFKKGSDVMFCSKIGSSKEEIIR